MRIHPHKYHHGFTLLEILLAVAFITALAAIPLLLAPTLLGKTNGKLAQTLITHALFEAQMRAESGYRDDSWGVQVLGESVTVFEGPSYPERVAAEDRITTFPEAIQIVGAGTDQIVFHKYSGEPSAVGEIAIAVGANDPLTITVGEKGTISY